MENCRVLWEMNSLLFIVSHGSETKKINKVKECSPNHEEALVKCHTGEIKDRGEDGLHGGDDEATVHDKLG